MKSKWVNSFTVALCLTIISGYIYSLDLRLVNLAELLAYDLKILSRDIRPTSGNVVIVAVDEKSLKEKGRWPWPRTLMAQLVDRLSEAEAAVIGFDVLFPEKDVYVPFATVKNALKEKDLSQVDSDSLGQWLEEVSDSDTHFAKSIIDSDRTVLGFFVYPTEESATDNDAEKLNQNHLNLLDFSQYSIVQKSPTENPIDLRKLYAVGLSLPKLMDAANAAGFVTFVPEIDGVIRRVPTVMEYGEYFFPPLSLQMLQQATQLPLAIRFAPFGIESVMLGDTVIPTSEKGDFLVNYYGPAHTFTHYSASDVLTGKVGVDELRGKIVLVGGTAAGTYDIHTSPFGPLYPGIEVHANVMESVINGEFLMRPDWLFILDLLMILISGIVLGLMALFLPAYSMALFLFVSISGYLFADWQLFTQKGLWVHTVYPVLSQVFVYSGIMLYRIIFEEREKRFIQGAFGQYLSPTVVDQLIDDPGMLKLGGERKELTAFFSDLASFTKISEALSPDQLVDLLNKYLTEMTDILLKHNGTVDKFEGDAIVSFFGAPVSFEDHARRSCFAALDMQKRLKELRSEWGKQGGQELHMRIGLNTGNMVVGNMGSQNRMDYTMMGDAVNLASRLEMTNKLYMTATMISEFTYEHVKDDVEVRELDIIRVIGKEQPIKIYELLGRKGEIDERMREIIPQFQEGFDYYKNRQWEEGIVCFENILNVHDDDGPSLVYFERCITFQNYPPDEDWDGVFTLRTK
jgi:adenylate cyclase